MVRLPVSYAEVAQLVERNLAKVEVAGSNLVFRSNDVHRSLNILLVIDAQISDPFISRCCMRK